MRLSDEEKVNLLYQRIDHFIESISNPTTFDFSIYNSNSPKKDRIRAWGEALEQIMKIQGREDEIDQISSIIRKELKEMKLYKALDWARESLPFKYKNSARVLAKQLLDYEYRTVEPYKLTKEEYVMSNQLYIDKINQDIQLLKDFQKKMETVEVLSKIPVNVFNEYVTRRDGMERLIRSSWDSRNDVLPEKLHLLIEGFVEGTKSNAFTMYLQYVRDIIKMTPKQTVKLLSGRVSDVELLYEPKSRRDARQCGFYGIPCDECGSWRVDYKYYPDVADNMLFCYSCKKWSNVRTEPLMNKLV